MNEIEILLIDDNAHDIQMTRETLSQNKLRNNLNIVSNVSDAKAFLMGEVYVPQPDLILLDSYFSQNMEQSIFNALKTDERLCNVPLVILTAVGIKPELLSYNVPPIGFVNKPLDFIQFIEVIKRVKSFRVAIVTSL